jgi:hypothetical protein
VLGEFGIEVDVHGSGDVRLGEGRPAVRLRERPAHVEQARAGRIGGQIAFGAQLRCEVLCGDENRITVRHDSDYIPRRFGMQAPVR